MLSAILVALSCVIVVALLWPTKDKKLKKIEQEECNGSNNNNQEKSLVNAKLRELSLLEMLWTFIQAFTVFWNKATYEYGIDLSRKYGRAFVFHWYKLVPTHPGSWIISLDLELSKKVHNLPEWKQRAPEDHYFFKTAWDKPYGLLPGCGEYYKRASRLTHRLLRQFEFFKPSRTEGTILFEAHEMEQQLEKRMAEEGYGNCITLCPHAMFERNALNVTWQVIMGNRFAHDDPIIGELLEVMDKANREFRLPDTILEFIPALRHIPCLTWLGATYKFSHMFYGVMEKMIAEKRREMLNGNGEPKDLMEGFILEIQKTGDGRGDEYMNDKQLMAVMRDLVAAGSDTVNSSLEHAILQLSLHPEVQRKVQAEIDTVVGHSRAVTYEDRHRLIYTQAVILEILRKESPVPGTARATKEDTVVNGVKVKKGSLFFMDIYAINRSEAIWEDPDDFRPERFLDVDSRTLINTEKIVPFGYGNRSCIGEALARVSLFIFFVTLFRKFSFSLSKEHPPPIFRNLHGVSRCPYPFYAHVCKRF